MNELDLKYSIDGLVETISEMKIDTKVSITKLIKSIEALNEKISILTEKINKD